MKVNISSLMGEKKYTHKIPCKTETTSGFGFYQPIFFRECAAQDTLTIRNGCMVRLQPVNKPTFGRLMVKQYKNFVGIADIWHPFDSFLSGKSYNGAIEQYIPEDFPNIPLWCLNLFCMCCSEISFFEIENLTSIDSGRGYQFSEPAHVTAVQAWKERYEEFVSAVQQRGTGVMDSFSTTIYDWTVNNTAQYENLDPNPQTGVREFDPERYDWIFPFTPEGGTVSYLSCGRFTERGKNLRKIVIGLGYQLNYDDTPVDLVRFVAFYKTWFDMFAIQREVTWKDTHAFNFMEFIEQSDLPGVLDFWEYVDNTSGAPYAQRAWDSFLSFWFRDLSSMYYTQNPDYISAHIVGTAISTQNEFGYLSADSSESVSSGEDMQPILPVEAYEGLSQQGLDILKKLYQYTNIATAVGGRIKEFMRSIFGSDYKQEEESTFIGSDSLMVDINPVMSSAETSEGTLGEYAGQGYGENHGDFLKYTCSRAGYVFVAFCIVPDARFVQGIDPNVYHKKKFDFFTQKFDSLTLLPSRKSIVYGINELGTNTTFKEGFGNIPNYMEYKQSYDRQNGDMSMRSTRQSLLPFSLQKLLWTGSVDKLNTTTPVYNVTSLNPALLVAGDVWRYIGRYRWLGNFDRIFTNAGSSANGQDIGSRPLSDLGLDQRDMDDNFILFFYNDITVTGFELPVADSFQTDPFGSNMQVEKA